MTRPTDAAIARAFWYEAEGSTFMVGAPISSFVESVMRRAIQFDAEQVTTSPEHVQIPAESEHVVPFDRCPTCAAHMPVGQTCGGVNCGLRRKDATE